MSAVHGVLTGTDRMGPEEIEAYALRLESLGYRALWLPDMLGRELFAVAGFVLAHTTRLHVATGIANVYTRDAVATAREARTLTDLYGPRFALGLGVSHPMVAEHTGQPWIPPFTKLSTYLDDIASANQTFPRPVAEVPIYIAAHGPKLLQLAARKADGANTYLMPPEHTRQAREALGDGKTLNVVLPCCLCEEPERAREVGRKGLAMYTRLPAYQRQWTRLGFSTSDFADGASDGLVDALVAWGGESALRDRIAAYRDAGADRVQILPYSAEAGGGTPWRLLETLAPGAP